MSFIEIKKTTGRARYKSGVSAGIRTRKGRLVISIILRADVMEKMNLKTGDKVMILRGTEEHRGVLCVKKGGGFSLSRYNRACDAGYITLVPWEGIKGQSCRLTSVNFNTDNDQITMDISRLFTSLEPRQKNEE